MKNFRCLALSVSLLVLVMAPVAVQAESAPVGTPTAAPTSSPQVAAAEVAAKDAFVLWKLIAVPFSLEHVYFLVQSGNADPMPVEGIATPVSKEVLLSGTRRWVVGTRVELPQGSEEVRYAVIVKGRSHDKTSRQITEAVFTEAETTKTLTSELLSSTFPDILREKLLQQKEVLKSYQIQVAAQEESLQRLRDDASVIGNLGRIIEVKDEAARTALSVKNLDRDIENLKSFLKLSRSRPQPKNYPSREAQLTGQVSELAQAAKSAESQEFQRRSRAEGDLKRKLNIIEQTRMEDYDNLQRTLLKLRRERMQLEKETKLRFHG